MSINQETIGGIAGGGRGVAYRQANRRNGQKYPSELLSWYSAQPRVNGLSYVLTPNGYVVLSTASTR